MSYWVEENKVEENYFEENNKCSRRVLVEICDSCGEEVLQKNISKCKKCNVDLCDWCIDMSHDCDTPSIDYSVSISDILDIIKKFFDKKMKKRGKGE